MGLDITAGSRIVFIEAYDDFETFDTKYYYGNPDSDRYINLYPNTDFPGREAPLDFQGKRAACYRIDGERIGFRAGSYSGYGAWRADLCQMANGIAPQRIWENRYDPQTQALPFYPLIDFSDCEGLLGSVVATRLAADFARFQAEADAWPDSWFREKYAQWQRACELAADSGFVKFH